MKLLVFVVAFDASNVKNYVNREKPWARLSAKRSMACDAQTCLETVETIRIRG